MVTVGIVFFNSENYLKDAISSVINQSYTSWRLLLINDGSTDNSVSIAREFLDDERVKIYDDGKNLGLAKRLNQMIDIVETEFICRMDADDIMHIDRLKIQMRLLEENPEIEVLGTNAFVINENNKVFAIRGKFSNQFILQKVKSLIHPSITARTVWFKNNRYDEKFRNRSQDMELWFRVSNTSTLVCLSQPLLFYREIEADYAAKYRKGLKEMIYFLVKYRSKYPAYIIFLRYFFSTILYHTIISSALLKRRNSMILNPLRDYSEFNI